MHTRILLLSLSIALSLVAPRIAKAQENRDPDAPRLVTPIGVGLTVGGGLTSFLRQEVRDFTDPGAAWNVRLTLGTSTIWSFEAIASGSMQGVDALGLDDDARLRSMGAEGHLRINFAREGRWQPYGFFGVGWKRYEITDADFNRSNMADQDDIAELPIGGGMALRYRGLILDVNAQLRLAVDSDLVNPVARDGRNTDLHTAGLNLAVGWEL
jgi:hypothetical protein